MARKSKISSVKNRRAVEEHTPAKDIKEDVPRFHCIRCDRSYVKQKGYFPISTSPLYKGNNGYVPICKTCLEELFTHYKDVLGSEKAALKRICLKFDYYWSDNIYDMMNKAATNSRVLSYLSKVNLNQYANKTFDDTLSEELNGYNVFIASPDSESDEIVTDQDNNIIVPNEIIEFWGKGFPPNFYIDLQKRFKDWCGNVSPEELDQSERVVLRQICILEATIARDAAQGKAIDKNMTALNTMLGSANLRPIQKKKEESANGAAANTPFGVWIKKFEDERPIPEPDEEFKDVNGIVRYITVWFFGHISKALGIKNMYSKLYEDEIAKLRIQRPEFEDTDDDGMISEIFGDHSEEDDES